MPVHTEEGLKETMLRLRISREEAETTQYVGDGVYATFDGYHLWARTLEGEAIGFEPSVMKDFVEYARARGMSV